METTLFIIFCLDVGSIILCMERLEDTSLRETIRVQYILCLYVCYVIALVCILFRFIPFTIFYK